MVHCCKRQTVFFGRTETWILASQSSLDPYSPAPAPETMSKKHFFCLFPEALGEQGGDAKVGLPPSQDGTETHF